MRHLSSAETADEHRLARDGYAVRSITRALGLLDAIRASPHGGMSLSALTESAQLPKSTVFRYLSTMEVCGYLQRDPANDEFRLASFFLSPQSERLAMIIRVARPHLQAVRDQVEETVNLAILDGRRVAYLEIIDSPWAVSLTARQSDRDPLHATALGKAIASQLPDERVRQILSIEGMPPRAANTITDIDVFLRVLADVRGNRYAVDDCEVEDGGRCVAVPLELDGLPPAAISISAPAFRLSLDSVESLSGLLTHTAEAVLRSIVT
jgi:IclR family transcriptional regulator, acetate operon repressor